MITQTLLGVALISNVCFSQPEMAMPSASLVEEKQILAQQTLDLTNRLPGEYGAQIFADNILLALHYLKGDVQSPKIDWERVRQPFAVSFTLNQGEVFAFHANVLPEFNPPVFDPEGLRPEWAGGPAVTMNSRFFVEEGYKSLAGLGGNGVCHLASLINWTASNAGLEVTAKVNHDFYPVPGVPREFGTSIQSQDKNQNLYIKNGFEFPVTFKFEADNAKIVLTVNR